MSRLSDIVSEAQPLGPLDQVKLKEPADSAAVLEMADPLVVAHKRHYTLIYGRKGSGKTAIISSYECYAHLRKREKFTSFITPHSDRPNYVVNIRAWNHLHDMMRSVLRGVVPVDLRGQTDELMQNTHVETIAQIWQEIVWEEIFKHFYTGYRNGDLRWDHFPNVIAYFDERASCDFSGSPGDQANSIIDGAKAEIVKHLNDEKRQILILFDTMEEYPITNPTFQQLLGGLVRAISRFDLECRRVFIVFSLPEELVEFFRSRSSNILKDFESTYAIRWKPIDLLRIVAHRYRLFLEAQGDQSIELYKALKLSERHDIQQFYANWLPEVVRNDFDGEEDALAYMARHTHLLPRHVLAIFDQAAIETQDITGGYRRITPDGIRRGIARKEEWLAREILQPFEFVYKDISRHLKGALQSLKPIFKYGELQRHAPKLRKEYDWDQDQLMEMLFHMGVLGRVVEERAGDGRKGGRYVYADFYYNRNGSIGFAHDAYYCVHPLFSKLCGCDQNRGNDKRIIYPNNVSFAI